MKSVMFTLALLLSLNAPLIAQLSPPKLKAVLLMKLSELEEHVSKDGKQVTIHVLSAPEVAAELRVFKGHKIGGAILTQVTESDSLPTEQIDILFVGTNNSLKEVIKYARSNNVMTVTDRADLFKKGLSVSIVMEGHKPKISLNPGPSLKEGLKWNLNFEMFQSLTLEFKNNSQ